MQTPSQALEARVVGKKWPAKISLDSDSDPTPKQSEKSSQALSDLNRGGFGFLILILSCTGCVTLEKSLNPPEPHFFPK